MKKVSYSVVLSEWSSDLESVDFVGSKSDCFKRARILANNRSFAMRYKILVRKEIISVESVLINSIYD